MTTRGNRPWQRQLSCLRWETIYGRFGLRLPVRPDGRQGEQEHEAAMQLHRRRDRCGPAARQLRYMDTVECPAGKSSANVNQGCGSPHAAGGRGSHYAGFQRQCRRSGATGIGISPGGPVTGRCDTRSAEGRHPTGCEHQLYREAVARFKGQTREGGETCGTVSRPTEGRNSSRREIDDENKKPAGGESATGNSFQPIRSENAPPAFPANVHGELDLAGNRQRRSDPRRAFDISAREPRAPRATRLAHCAGQLEPAIHYRRHCGPAQPTQRCRQVARHPSD